MKDLAAFSISCLLVLLLGSLSSCTTAPRAVDPFDAMLARAMQNIADEMKPEPEKP